jgi:hypothetical protein
MQANISYFSNIVYHYEIKVSINITLTKNNARRNVLVLTDNDTYAYVNI